MEYRLYNADTLNRYAKDCHQRAVAKGFWDETHSIGHSLMLAFGELHEAIEADRIGKWAKLTPDKLRSLNSAAFAQAFLWGFFLQNGDNYFGSWFWSNSVDVMVLASQYLLAERPLMPNFKLSTVAAQLGVSVSEDKLHDALYDVDLTRDAYHIKIDGCDE